MKKGLIIGFLVLVVLISGCTSAPEKTAPQATNTPPQHTTPPPLQAAKIEIVEFTFYPAEVAIVKGGTVTWSQKDSIKHTVTGSDFDSGELGQGQTFSHTFNEAGTFDFWCKIHSSMRGKVIVK